MRFIKPILCAVIFVTWLISCKNQEKKSTSDNSKPEIGLPLGNVSPDQALLEVQVIDFNGGILSAKVAKQIEVGNSFKEILQTGQKIEMSCNSCTELAPKDKLSCIIEKSVSGSFRLISYNKQ